MVFTSLESLISGLQGEIEAAVNEAESKGYLSAVKNTSDYRQVTPKVYEVTYQLENSARTTGVIGGGNHYEAEIYLDEGFNYDTGTWSTPKIFDIAESGGLINPGGFWARTEDEIEQEAIASFSKRFK